ncbi:MAG: hypothetical protein IKH88_14975 [Prevotella sp.]|nr:hypothetical protein [Prevotella sp.]
MSNKAMMILGLMLLLIVGCNQESLEERAQREFQEFTRKNCPKDQGNNVILDSLVFDKSSRTLIEYSRVTNECDDEEFIRSKKASLDEGSIQLTRQEVSYKRLRDAGFSFRFILRSHSSGKVLYDKTVTKDDYGY